MTEYSWVCGGVSAIEGGECHDWGFAMFARSFSYFCSCCSSALFVVEKMRHSYVIIALSCPANQKRVSGDSKTEKRLPCLNSCH